jgi:di/tricarboxylate transporter
MIYLLAILAPISGAGAIMIFGSGNAEIATTWAVSGVVNALVFTLIK